MTKFLGFDSPEENWSKLPHEFINALPLFKSLAELKVVLYVLRHTWGYHDENKRISIDEFSRGRKKRDGLRLDAGCGLADNIVKDGIRRAIEHGFLTVEEDITDSARIKRHYALRMKVGAVVRFKADPPDVGGLKQTPGGSTLDPLDSKVDPRSKKETLRNIPGKETIGAPARPRTRDALFDAICEVCRVDAKTAGATVGKVKAILVKAEYSAEDVKSFGEWWWSDEFRKRRNIPPTVWQLNERIGIVRSASADSKMPQYGAPDRISGQQMTPAQRAILLSREKEKASGDI